MVPTKVCEEGDPWKDTTPTLFPDNLGLMRGSLVGK
jgi:hypothetical protein